MKPKNTLPVHLLSEHFILSGDGKIYWKTRRHKRRLDIPAGTVHPRGYRMIVLKLDGVLYRLYSHRVAFAMRSGRWPEHQIDHRNGRDYRDDNSIENLREATDSQNKCNKPIQANNKIGLKWVKRDNRRKNRPWKAAVRKNGKAYEKSGFPSKEEAYLWASNIAKQLHGEFYHQGG